MTSVQTAMSGDVLTEKITNGVQSILDAALKENDDLSSFDNRAHDLPTLPRELAVVMKLEQYYQGRTYELKQRRENQEKLRTRYRYLRLPRLPVEIIIRILSYLDSRNVINTASSYSISVTAFDLLPYLILKPYLLLPPYCECFDDTKKPEELIALLTLKDINEATMEMKILTEVDDLALVSLYVCIKDWERVRDDENDTLRLLLENPRRWKDLGLSFKKADQIPQMLDALAPCLPYIKEFNLKRMDRDDDFMFSRPVPSIAADSSKNISFPLTALPTLFSTSLLNYVTDLVLDNARIREPEDMQKSVMKELPHILSGLPCLKRLALSLYSPIFYEEYKSLKVRSSSLRILSLKSIGRNEVPFLTLFSECQIETIDAFGWGQSLTNLVEFFPGVKELYCSGENALSDLSSPDENGKLAFPQLEILSIAGLEETNEGDFPIKMTEEDINRIFELILRIVRDRASTPGVTPIKRLISQPFGWYMEDPKEWQERIEHYVDVLDF